MFRSFVWDSKRRKKTISFYTLAWAVLNNLNGTPSFGTTISIYVRLINFIFCIEYESKIYIF